MRDTAMKPKRKRPEQKAIAELRIGVRLVDRYLEAQGGENSGFIFVVHEVKLAERIDRAIAKAYRRGLRDAAGWSAS